MKKILISLVLLFSLSICFAEVSIKYNSKMCKLEIITSQDIKNKNAKELVEKKVLEFCKDKYIYNIEIAVDKGKYVYIIMYNDMVD